MLHHTTKFFQTSKQNILRIAEGVTQRDRRSIAKAITLIESTSSEHVADASLLLRTLRQQDPNQTLSQMRIAVSGTPGAGKSTFIEALGMHLANLGRSVAVMAIDPSSSIGGGSLLGDKTRMVELSMHPNAFVRPSPSRGHLGGVTARCDEVMTVFAAANYDITLIETVGVGQSEVAAKHVTDVFILLLAPAAGDELQGAKKGIVEMADVIIVNKADGQREGLANDALHAYQRAAHLASRKAPPMLKVSSQERKGIDAAWEVIEAQWNEMKTSATLAELRASQRAIQFRNHFELELLWRARSLLEKSGSWMQLQKAARNNEILAREGAEMALAEVLRK